MDLKWLQHSPSLLAALSFFLFIPHTSDSKMNADKRVESPIPLLPLSSPDVDAENLIKKKDEEVRCGETNTE